MIISAIAALGHNRVIGKDGTLPWHLPLEFKHFKKKTLHRTLITGRKNFESIPLPLAQRSTIVLTTNRHYQTEHARVAYDFLSALSMAKDSGEKEVFIIGGSAIYQLSMPYLHRFYRTRVDFNGQGDVYFPPYEHYPWKVVETTCMEVQDNNPLCWTYDLLEKEPQKELP